VFYEKFGKISTATLENESDDGCVCNCGFLVKFVDFIWPWAILRNSLSKQKTSCYTPNAHWLL